MDVTTFYAVRAGRATAYVLVALGHALGWHHLVHETVTDAR